MSKSQMSFITTTIVRIAILMLSFITPFVWALSTGLVWSLGKQIPGSVSDAAIAFPSGIPIVVFVVLTWVVCFIFFDRSVRSILASTLISNCFAVLVFIVLYTFQFGLSQWLPFLDDVTNLLPMRFLLATVLSFAPSLLVARYFTKQINTPDHG